MKKRILYYPALVVLVAVLTFQCTEEKEEEIYSSLSTSSPDITQLAEEYNLQPLPPGSSSEEILKFDNVEEARDFLEKLRKAELPHQELTSEEDNSTLRVVNGQRSKTFSWGGFISSTTKYIVTVAYTYCSADGRFLNVKSISGIRIGGSFGKKAELINTSANITPKKIDWRGTVVFRGGLDVKGVLFGYQDAKTVSGVIYSVSRGDGDRSGCDDEEKDYYFDPGKLSLGPGGGGSYYGTGGGGYGSRGSYGSGGSRGSGYDPGQGVGYRPPVLPGWPSHGSGGGSGSGSGGSSGGGSGRGSDGTASRGTCGTNGGGTLSRPPCTTPIAKGYQPNHR